MKKTLKNSLIDIIFYRQLFIAILLSIVGIIFLYNFNNLNIKIGSSLLLIGNFFIMFFNINEKTKEKSVTGKHIFLIFTIWLLIILGLTYNMDADIFLIIAILGILSLREFLIGFTTPTLLTRMNIHFYLLLIIFIIIIGQRIINIITM